MTVELDVYSGRPNPWWQISSKEIDEIADSLKNLPRADAPPEGGIGYRGFVISNSGHVRDLPPRIRVANGVITFEDGDRISHFVDEHGLETRLAEEAAAHGYRELIDVLRPPR